MSSMCRPAGGDVGGDEDLQLALAELPQRVLALALAQVAVDRGGAHALLVERSGEPVGDPLGVGEREGASAGPGDGGGDLHLVHLVHGDEAVDHGVDRDRGRGDLVVHGVVLVALDQPVDDAVEGGGEQQRLVLVVDVAEQPLDLGQEAHVGHAVGFVDHDELEAAELDLLAVDQVDEASRRGDDRLDARRRAP